MAASAIGVRSRLAGLMNVYSADVRAALSTRLIPEINFALLGTYGTVRNDIRDDE